MSKLLGVISVSALEHAVIEVLMRGGGADGTVVSAWPHPAPTVVIIPAGSLLIMVFLQELRLLESCVLPVHTFVSDPAMDLVMLLFAYDDRLNTKERCLDCLLFCYLTMLS